eukprot:3118632-Heterocapsa_arctica.AAC.1
MQVRRGAANPLRATSRARRSRDAAGGSRTARRGAARRRRTASRWAAAAGGEAARPLSRATTRIAGTGAESSYQSVVRSPGK